ncbi:MAG: sigma-70 family RNA polymerase sigma factor [Fibrobacter sp.]|nr:sigma-70 family RNA polymerase sigma factor [Fibrobacter sp.]
MKQLFETKAGFTRLYERFAPMVYRRCLFLMRSQDEAEDLTQEVFLRIYANRTSLDLNAPSSLFWNTATHLCLNRIRDCRRRGTNRSSEDMLLLIADSHDELDEYENKSILEKIFSREPESTRTMAVLHFVDGMTLEDVAEQVGLSVSGVRKRLRTLKEKLNMEEI